jgi:hypothetical protein
MNLLARDKRSNDPNTPCADLMTMAQRELSAFFNAVIQSFGLEQAQISAEDWLRELTNVDHLPASAREWRRITARASIRLASRVSASAGSSSLSTQPQIA